MQINAENIKSLPVLATTDVLVVGGGPAGISAAIAAARSGAKVILMEHYGSFGGNITHVGVEAFAWYRHEGTIEAGGITKEFEQRAIEMDASVKEIQSDSQALDAELFKFVADRMILDENIEPLLHCTASDVIMEDGIIKGVITQSKSGRQIIYAQRVVDCTGDADIAAFCHAPFTKGSSKELMHLTPIFNCKNVDTAKFKDYIYNDLKPTYKDWSGDCWSQITSGKETHMFSPFFEKPFIEAIKEGLITPDENVAMGGTFSSIHDATGEVMQINVVFMSGYDCTDVKDLTRAEIQGRKHVLMALKVLREKVPGFENAQIRDMGMTIGTRESRKIEGHAYLTEHDILNEGRFEDTIGIYPEFVDGLNYLYIPTTGRYFQIPYGCLLPKKVDNLLVAGRSISGDRVAHCSFRNMSCCSVTGQAAGTAAAVSIKQNVPVSQIDIKELQNTLRHDGVRID